MLSVSLVSRHLPTPTPGHVTKERARADLTDLDHVEIHEMYSDDLEAVVSILLERECSDELT